MLVIGEKINASNELVAEAITKRDEELLANLAKAQASAGADFIDVNAGGSHGSLEEAKADIKWLVGTIQAAIEQPLSIDSDSPEVVEAALKEYRRERLIINSVTAEPARLESIGPLVADRQAQVIALAMGTEGIPASVEERMNSCERIMTFIAIPPSALFFILISYWLDVDLVSSKVNHQP